MTDPRALTELERGALGELIQLATFFYAHRKRVSQRNFGIVCAERAAGILSGTIAPVVATDDAIRAFSRFWQPERRPRHRASEQA